jgi:hypothetical protein
MLQAALNLKACRGQGLMQVRAVKAIVFLIYTYIPKWD